MAESKTVRAGERDRQHRTSPATFYRQVVAELRKVVWPTQEQLVTYFIVTMVFVVFVMAIVSVPATRSSAGITSSSPGRFVASLARFQSGRSSRRLE